jgi:hypothetical protein
MPTEYVIDPGIEAAVSKMVNDEAFTEFIPIRKQNVIILAAAKITTDKDGIEKPGTGEPIQVKKVSDSDRVFLEGHYKLYFDWCRWTQANEQEQKAMLHRTLMRLSVEEKEGGIKYGTRVPDIIEFHATVVRFGAWTESLVMLRNNLQAAQAKMKAEKKSSGS